jgi:hypothetical protein
VNAAAGLRRGRRGWGGGADGVIGYEREALTTTGRGTRRCHMKESDHQVVAADDFGRHLILQSNP